VFPLNIPPFFKWKTQSFLKKCKIPPKYGQEFSPLKLPTFPASREKMGTFKRRRNLKRNAPGMEISSFPPELIHSKSSFKNHRVNLHPLKFYQFFFVKFLHLLKTCNKKGNLFKNQLVKSQKPFPKKTVKEPL